MDKTVVFVPSPKMGKKNNRLQHGISDTNIPGMFDKKFAKHHNFIIANPTPRDVQQGPDAAGKPLFRCLCSLKP